MGDVSIYEISALDNRQFKIEVAYNKKINFLQLQKEGFLLSVYLSKKWSSIALRKLKSYRDINVS